MPNGLTNGVPIEFYDIMPIMMFHLGGITATNRNVYLIYPWIKSVISTATSTTLSGTPSSLKIG